MAFATILVKPKATIAGRCGGGISRGFRRCCFLEGCRKRGVGALQPAGKDAGAMRSADILSASFAASVPRVAFLRSCWQSPTKSRPDNVYDVSEIDFLNGLCHHSPSTHESNQQSRNLRVLRFAA